jgi:hypothetical protein
MATASSSVLKAMTVTTGPKISSVAIRMSRGDAAALDNGDGGRVFDCEPVLGAVG